VGDLIFTGPELGSIVSGVFTPRIDIEPLVRGTHSGAPILGYPFWGTHKKMTENTLP
jgi:hypothetical protein